MRKARICLRSSSLSAFSRSNSALSSLHGERKSLAPRMSFDIICAGSGAAELLFFRAAFLGSELSSEVGGEIELVKVLEGKMCK